MSNMKRKEQNNIPATAAWRLKGDGVAYTTSREILRSQAGQRQIRAAAKVKLKRSG